MIIRRLIPFEFYKYFTRFNMILISVMLFLTLGITGVVYRKYFTSDYREFQAKKDDLIFLYKNDRDEYTRILNEHMTRVDEYNKDVMASFQNSRGKALPVFENDYINLEDYGDRELFDAVEKVIRNPAVYRNKMTSVLRDAIFRLEEADEGSYIEEYYLEFCAAYITLSELELKSEEVRGWNEYFSFQLPSAILLIVLLTTLCTTFTDDIRVGMVNVLHISKYGGIHVIVSKLIFIGITSGLITLIFTVLPLIVFSLSSGLSSLSHPVQMIDALVNCPFRLTVGQYLLIYLSLRICIFTVFSLFITVVNQFFNNEKFAFVTATIVVVSGLFLAEIAPQASNYYLQKFSITEIAGINILFEKYRGLNIGGHCVNYSFFVEAVVLIILIALVVISLFTKTESVNEYFGNDFNTSKSSCTMSLFKTEVFKQLVCARFLILILASVLIKSVIAGVYYYPTDNYDEKQYKSYIQKVEGGVTEEKLQWIEEESQYIEFSISEYNIAEARFNSNNMSEAEFEEYKNKRNYAEYYRTGCERLCERRDYLINIIDRYPNVEFVYDEGLDRYFGSPIDITAVIIIVFMASNMFACEYERGFFRMMRTTRRGRKTTFLTKLVYSLLVATIIYCIFGLIEAGFIGYYYDTDYWYAPIQSMPRFADIEANFTVGEYLLISRGVAWAGYLLAYVLAFSLSAVMQSQIKSIIMSLFIMAIPYILTQTSVISVSVLNYLGMITPNDITHDILSYITCTLISVMFCTAAYLRWCGKEREK